MRWLSSLLALLFGPRVSPPAAGKRFGGPRKRATFVIDHRAAFHQLNVLHDSLGNPWTIMRARKRNNAEELILPDTGDVRFWNDLDEDGVIDWEVRTATNPVWQSFFFAWEVYALNQSKKRSKGTFKSVAGGTNRMKIRVPHE